MVRVKKYLFVDPSICFLYKKQDGAIIFNLNWVISPLVLGKNKWNRNVS